MSYGRCTVCGKPLDGSCECTPSPKPPEQAAPFPPRIWVVVNDDAATKEYTRLIANFKPWTSVYGAPKEYLSLEEHASLIRAARAETACHLSQRLVSLCYGEADDDGNAELLTAKEIEKKLIAEMDRCIDAHMKAAAREEAPKEEK